MWVDTTACKRSQSPLTTPDSEFPEGKANSYFNIIFPGNSTVPGTKGYSANIERVKIYRYKNINFTFFWCYEIKSLRQLVKNRHFHSWNIKEKI